MTTSTSRGSTESQREAILSRAPTTLDDKWGRFTDVGDDMLLRLRGCVLTVRSFDVDADRINERMDTVARWFLGAAVRGKSRPGVQSESDFIETDYTVR